MLWTHHLSCIAAKLAKGELKREDIFITTKHWRKYHGYEPTLQCLKMSIRALKVDYIDLWLMHWPGPGYWTMSRSKQLLEEHGPWYFALGAAHRPEPVPGHTEEVSWASPGMYYQATYSTRAVFAVSGYGCVAR